MVSRHGLSELYVPPQDKATTAVLIFVHGLFGHPYKTWASSPSKGKKRSSSPQGAAQSSQSPRPSGESHDAPPADGSTFWPQTLLPKVIPDVRIYTWGYDADIGGFSSASQNTIHQHAGNLLTDLIDLRDESEHNRRPIIFVVHSLGGIIVKEALNQSRSTTGTRVKEVAPATSAICFLGTPHRGSGTASIGKIAYQVTVAATKRPNSRLLQDLERNSPTLDAIGDSFSQTLSDSRLHLRIFSYREEKMTRKYVLFSTMVVDANSAKIGDGREGNSSIPADHSNMTKFEGSEDVGFRRVSALLRRWVGELRDIEVPDEDESDCIYSLATEKTKRRFHEVKEAAEQTFHWLFDPDIVSFSDWLSASSPAARPLYWIQGKPGSGKSTLMKFAIRDDRTWKLLGIDEGPSWTCASFFFHDRGFSIQKSLDGMLQELVSSLLEKLPELFFCFRLAYTELAKSQRTKCPIWDLDSLESVIYNIVDQRKVPIKIIIFLDALDEHSGDNDELAQILKSMIQRADYQWVVLKICLASRPWNVFEQQFGKELGFSIHNHTQEDIYTYTSCRLRRSIEDHPELLSPKHLDSLTQQITAKALGVFIWVRLVVDQLMKEIRDGTAFPGLEERIGGMPQELENLYADMLRRLEPTYANEAYIMFHIAISSMEPLPLDTFMLAVEFVMSNKEYLSSNIPINVNNVGRPDSVFAHLRRLNSRSGGLLETQLITLDTLTASALGVRGRPPSFRLDEDGREAPQDYSYVEFLHATAKDYIRNNQDTILVEQTASPFVDFRGNDFLFMSCASCEDWVNSIKKDLLYYAKMAEMRIIPAAQRNDVVVHGSAEHKIQLKLNGYMCYILSHIVSIGGGTYDFDWWLRSRKETLFRLLEQKRRNMAEDYVVLILAVVGNLKHLVPELVSSKFLENSNHFTTTNEMSLVYVAAVGPNLGPPENHDRIGMIKLLVSSGYYVDERSSPEGTLYLTPLADVVTKAIQREDLGEATLRVAECLLQQGADPNLTTRLEDRNELLLLSYSVQYLSVAFVRLLLRYGAETNPSVQHLKPAQHAAIRQDKAIIEAVREFGGSLKPQRAPFDDPDAVYRPTKEATLGMGGMGFCGSIGHPAVAFACAQASSWSSERKRFAERAARIGREEAALNRPSTATNP